MLAVRRLAIYNPRRWRALSAAPLIIEPRFGLDAAAELAGIGHGLPDNLKDLSFEDVGANLGIPAPLDLGRIMHVLPCPPVTTVHGTVIHRDLPRASSEGSARGVTIQASPEPKRW